MVDSRKVYGNQMLLNLQVKKNLLHLRNVVSTKFKTPVSYINLLLPLHFPLDSDGIVLEYTQNNIIGLIDSKIPERKSEIKSPIKALKIQPNPANAFILFSLPKDYNIMPYTIINRLELVLKLDELYPNEPDW